MAGRGGKNSGLKGQELIDKILELTGSSNLVDYEGNIRDIGARCEWLNLYNLGGKGGRGGLFRFFRAYYEALKDLNLYQNDIHSNYEDLQKELHKKYEPIPEKKKKKLTRKDFINEQNQPQENINQRNKPLENIDELRGTLYQSESPAVSFLEQVIALHSEGKSEASICIITGYEVEKIGQFRRAFAKEARVQLAPLSRMIKELKEKELISKTPLVNIENNDSEELIEIEENNETDEFIDTEELFIDREKITSQVNRTYRNPKFRKKVLAKYGSVCACCDIAIETLLEAAHIIPVENNGNDDAGNGIPLCPTHHTAFDNFLFTINPSDKSIIYKEGLGAEDIQITKTKCDINVSKESLDYRFKLFNE